MIYGAYDYYTHWLSAKKNGYKCKGVRNAQTGKWRFEGGARHHGRFPGCTFCPGLIHREIAEDGSEVWKLKIEHECVPLSIVDLEAGNPVAGDTVSPSTSVSVSTVALTPAVVVPIEADPAPELPAESPAEGGAAVEVVASGGEGTAYEMLASTTETSGDEGHKRRNGEVDDRPPMVVLFPPPYLQMDEELKKLGEDLKKCQKWREISGGDGGKRLYLPSLESDPMLASLHARVRAALAPYVAQLRKNYPNLRYFKYGAILSRRGARSQYVCHYFRLHSDYSEECHLRLPWYQPCSIILAIDPFKLTYLPEHSMPDCERQTMAVAPTHALGFTNAVLHAGEENEEPYDCVRLFGYGVHMVEDFPKNKIWLWPTVAEGEIRAQPLERKTSYTASLKDLATGCSLSGRQCFKRDLLMNYQAKEKEATEEANRAKASERSKKRKRGGI